ncbi:GNAT family N-acetyltransferase [Campylobacter geochelonis]|uniref:GNAT family N-acetyltransferase n=1 Tax=Campylobacter geochelonis TaxID=1780362 RepID=UPI000770B4F2|nr:N-acetyltransferase [Campylobacter geochelonis]CZE49916.1 ribosomal-protein-alanine acetyltransferase [Campylobacter geochelonis]
MSEQKTKFIITKATICDTGVLFKLENECFDKFNSPLSKASFYYHIKRNFLYVARAGCDVKKDNFCKLNFKNSAEISLIKEKENWANLKYNFIKNSLICGEFGKILGYILILPKLKTSRIYSLAVLPNARGLGVAKALLEFGISRFNSLKLEVRTDNTKAINLYEKLGFKSIKTLPKYYDDGCDAFLMVKSEQIL